MTSALKTRFYIFCLSLLAAFVLFSPEAVRAKKAVALPDYVITQFGKPPAVPTGPLNAEIKGRHRHSLHQKRAAIRLA